MFVFLFLNRTHNVLAPFKHDPTGQFALTLNGSKKVNEQDMEIDEKEDTAEKERAEKRELERQNAFKEVKKFI